MAAVTTADAIIDTHNSYAKISAPNTQHLIKLNFRSF